VSTEGWGGGYLLLLLLLLFEWVGGNVCWWRVHWVSAATIVNVGNQAGNQQWPRRV
jgi:hypothetical protein